MASRPIDTTLHGVADYTTGALLQVLPKALDIEGSTAAKVLRGAGAVHGGYSLFTDYPLGAAEAMPVRLHPGPGGAAARVRRGAGAVHGGYSLFTDYPLGAVKAIPFRVHMGLDAVWAVALGAAPVVTGRREEGRGRRP